MTDDYMMTLDEFDAEQFGAMEAGAQEFMFPMDAEIASHRCEGCQQRRTAHGYKYPSPSFSYRVFSVCPRCRNAYEF